MNYSFFNIKKRRAYLKFFSLLQLDLENSTEREILPLFGLKSTFTQALKLRQANFLLSNLKLNLQDLPSELVPEAFGT